MSAQAGEVGTAAQTWVKLVEYNLADAVRVTGAKDATIKNWMHTGWLREGEWRRVPDARGEGLHGYSIKASAIARIQAKRGKPCRWEAAQAAQVSPEVAAMLTQQQAHIRELEALNAKYSRQIGLTRKYGKAGAKEHLGAEWVEPDEPATARPQRTPRPPVPADVADEAENTPEGDTGHTSTPGPVSTDDWLRSMLRPARPGELNLKLHPTGRGHKREPVEEVEQQGPWRTPDGREVDSLAEALAAATDQDGEQ